MLPMSYLKKNKAALIAALVIIALIPSAIFLFHPGFPVTDDGDWMIIRFSAFYQALLDGQFPTRFLGRLNFGYGYPVANFLYPAFMYLATPIKAAGLSFIDSIKVISALSMVAGGAFMFLYARKMFGDISAVAASLFYTYAPYHLFDLYRRGSVGEILALAVVPFIFWQLERKSLFFASTGIALLIISHNTLALLFTALIFLYLVIKLYEVKFKRKVIYEYLLVALFGIGISSFFWIPAIFELPFTVFASTRVSDVSGYFADMNLIGLSALTILIIAATPFIQGLKDAGREVFLFALVSILSLFFASFLSQIFWLVIPANFIQFPFRLLSLTIFSLGLLLAFGLSRLPTKYALATGIFVFTIVLFDSRDFALSQKYSDNPDTFYSTNEATTTVADEYMPIWVREKPAKHFDNKVEIVKGEGKVSDVFYNSSNITFNYSSETPSIIRINTIYYPGWVAFSNGVQKAIFYDNNYGLMDIKLESGDQRINLSFGETPLRFAASIISIFSLVILPFWILRQRVLKIIRLKI